MSGFSSIYSSGATSYPVTSTSPPAATDFWLSSEFYNTGINSLIIYLYSNCNNGAGLSALRVMLVEAVINLQGNFQNYVIAEVNLNTPYNGGLPSVSRNAIIFNQIGYASNAPTQTTNLWGNTQTLVDQDGKSITINGSSTKGAVSATAYFPEKFRVLLQNTGSGGGTIGNILIRAVK